MGFALSTKLLLRASRLVTAISEELNSIPKTPLSTSTPALSSRCRLHATLLPGHQVQWCPGPDSNRYASREAGDFKSPVSTISPPGRRRKTVRSVPGGKRPSFRALCNRATVKTTKGVHRSERPLHWSGKRGSNSRPQPWQGCALPTELFPHELRAERIP